ncbi:Cupredoxin [Marasmius fiardii PR-910]|nr:Cupredoxin [Marasmius fiardii PR-910]
MRLVNMACDPMFKFYVEGHDMDIIEVDGVSHQTMTVDNLKIYSGQRYSFILNANQKVDNYWIRARPNAGLEQSFINGLNSAVLRYEGAPEQEPAATDGDDVVQKLTKPLKESKLAPLEKLSVPGQPRSGGVDYALHLQWTFNETTPNFLANGQEMVAPSAPVLLQILSGTSDPSKLLPAGMLYPLPMNSSVEISISGGLLGIEHPVHLHGHAFDVVRVAGSQEYNYVNPVRRDVVNAGTMQDNVTFRFQTDNPGPWFLHCHIDWHLATYVVLALLTSIIR